MSFGSRLTHTVSIVRKADAHTLDDYGQPITSDEVIDTVKAAIQPRRENEQGAVSQAGAATADHVIFLFPTSLRCEHGLVTDVEISAALVRENDDAYLGFTIRDVSRRQGADARAPRELPRSAGQLSELVGRVPMKDIVGETTDLIEQLCIEAALDLTRDNRAAAAEMLGMSRQSLYVKLRRYGLGEVAAEGERT